MNSMSEVSRLHTHTYVEQHVPKRQEAERRGESTLYSQSYWSCPYTRHKQNSMSPLCLASRHEDVSGSGGIAPCILNFGTGGRWAVSFTSRPLYPIARSPQHTFYRGLGGSHSRPGPSWRECCAAPAGSQTPIPWSSSQWSSPLTYWLRAYRHSPKDTTCTVLFMETVSILLTRNANRESYFREKTPFNVLGPIWSVPMER
jgi:hypothetical protein